MKEEKYKEAIEGAEKDLKERLPEILTSQQSLGGDLFQTHKIINKIWEKRFGEFK